MRILLLSALLLFGFGFDFNTVRAAVGGVEAASTMELTPTIKFPVLLLCQHKEKSSSWSLCLRADKNDPSKPVSLVLEELVGKNSKDDKYNGVLIAHQDTKTVRPVIKTINADQFGKTKLEIVENQLLSVDVVPTTDGLRLDVKARISLDGFFAIGTQPGAHGVVYLKYDKTFQTWEVVSDSLSGINGTSVPKNTTIKSILFLSGTRVSLIVAVDKYGKPTKLLDD